MFQYRGLTHAAAAVGQHAAARRGEDAGKGLHLVHAVGELPLVAGTLKEERVAEVAEHKWIHSQAARSVKRRFVVCRKHCMSNAVTAYNVI